MQQLIFGENERINARWIGVRKGEVEAMHSTEIKDNVGILNLPLPTFVPRRYRPGNLGNWSAHLAFAHDLIGALQPHMIVELGTHWGESYFGFCQSVAEHGLSCLCYAVDHWLGEEHAGRYGEEVYEDVRQYNETYYKAFSYLLRTSFDDAVLQFHDDTIGLLHIDGLHTYEAASHDFRTWLPKVKPGGIVLLHDIAVRHADFGIWRLWDEIKAEFPETFEFHHSWGLGVVRKPAIEGVRQELLEILFNSPASAQEHVRRFYILYAAYLENSVGRAEGTHAGTLAVSAQAPGPTGSGLISQTQVQVFTFGPAGYSEDRSSTQIVDTGEWRKVIFEFPQGIGTGRLRVDPAGCSCVVELSAISIASKESGTLLWSATVPYALRQLELSGTLMPLPQEDKCLLLSYGDDPQVILPVIEDESMALIVEISLKLDVGADAIDIAVETLQAARLAAESQTATAKSLAANLRAELHAAQAERMLVAAELARVASEKNELRRELKRSEQAYSHAIKELTSVRSSLELEQKIRSGMEHSRSWEITKPMRSFMFALRGKRETEVPNDLGDRRQTRETALSFGTDSRLWSGRQVTRVLEEPRKACTGGLQGACARRCDAG